MPPSSRWVERAALAEAFNHAIDFRCGADPK